MPVWKKAGGTIMANTTALKEYMEKDIAHVLIDLRDAGALEKGFVKGAVSIPGKDLESAKERFPADKSAPIILYSDTEDVSAFRIVSGWGYKNAAVLAGGSEAWTRDGGKLGKGKLPTAISYVPKPRPGEISIEDFKAAAEKPGKNRIILDVRDKDETMNGMIAGAINMPAGDITSRLKELPKNKEIITHCVTGLRAESAYDDLKAAGYKVKFLNAVIQIDQDGKYEITKK